jgi:zinc/manganese transport system substrate-binding protein
MSRRASIVLTTLLTALLAALGPTACGDRSGDRPQIVVTTNILGNVVSELVADQADVTVLMKPNADLVVYNGLGLEEGIAQHVEAARTAGVPVFEAGTHADPIKYASGDSADTLDPHFWTDPDRMKMVVSALRPVLAETVTDVNTAQLDEQTDSYLERLTELTDDMAAQFATIPADRKRLVTNHHVFGYLAERFGFEVIGAIIPGGTTLASPSSSDLASLTSAIDRYDVSAVFVDTSHPDKLAAALARETCRDVKIVPLYSESLDEPGTEAGTYLGMMAVNARRITDGLR